MAGDSFDRKDRTDQPSGIPERLRVKRRSYTLTEKALEARRKNAQKSTGPRTEEGKRRSSRNAWKHGLYSQSFILGKLGRPCRRSCDKYPCELIEDGRVSPGDFCLDKQFVAEAFEAVISAINKETEDFNALAALEIASAVDILRKLKEAILEDGVLVKKEHIDKEGNVIGHEYIPHPLLAHYEKMMLNLGLTPQEFLITPKELKRSERGMDDEERESVADIMSRAFRNLAKIEKRNED